MSKHTHGDAIRMAGHLLEHHPGVNEPHQVIDGKACFCFYGAVYESFRVLNLLDRERFLPLGVHETVCDTAFPHVFQFGMVYAWEGKSSDESTRLAAARRLQNYPHP